MLDSDTSEAPAEATSHIELGDHPWAGLCRDFCARWDQTSFHPDFPIHPLASFEPDVRAVGLPLTTHGEAVMADYKLLGLAQGEHIIGILRPVLAEAGQGGGTPFERDAGVVLRRVEEAVRDTRAAEPDNRRAFLELLGRIVRKEDPDQPQAGAAQSPRLIVP